MEITTKPISAGSGEPRSPADSIWRPAGRNEPTPEIKCLEFNSQPDRLSSLQLEVRPRATARRPRDLAPTCTQAQIPLHSPKPKSLLVPCPGCRAFCQSSPRRNMTSLSEHPPAPASPICTPPRATSVSESSCPRSGPGPHQGRPARETTRRQLPRDPGRGSPQNKNCF